MKNWLERLFRVWVADPVVNRMTWYLGLERSKGITSVYPTHFKDALDRIAEASAEWRNNHSVAGAYEVGDMLYELHIAAAGLAPLEKQALALQEVQSENARLKAALRENAERHRDALLHLVRLLPESDTNRGLYAYGAARLTQQLGALK